jgi:S1-C subfamily serine protease
MYAHLFRIGTAVECNILLCLILSLATVAPSQPSVTHRESQPAAIGDGWPGVVSVIHNVDVLKLFDRLSKQGNVQVGIIGPARTSILNITTGLVIDNEGHVVTRLVNLDPRDNDQDISIAEADGRRHPARLIGVDCATGFAVLKVDSLNLPLPNFLHPSALSDGMPVRVLSADVLKKAESAEGEIHLLPSIKVLGGTVMTDNTYARARRAYMLRSPGLSLRNDSSVVVAASGEVIGIAQFAGFGRAYLYSIDFIRSTVVKRVLETKGSVPAGWLGISGGDIHQMAGGNLTNFPRKGVIVREVYPNSPAATCGIKPNDVIVGLDDIEVNNLSDLSAALAVLPAGRKMRVQAIREQKPVEIDVVLGAREYAPPSLSLLMPSQTDPELQRAQIEKQVAELQAQIDKLAQEPLSKGRRMRLQDIQNEMYRLQQYLAGDFTADKFSSTTVEAHLPGGLAIRPLTAQLASYFGANSGLLVTRVAKDSPAARAGLKAGDVIIEVRDLGQATANLLRSILSSSRGTIPLKVIRDKKLVLIEMVNLPDLDERDTLPH